MPKILIEINHEGTRVAKVGKRFTDYVRKIWAYVFNMHRPWHSSVKDTRVLNGPIKWCGVCSRPVYELYFLTQIFNLRTSLLFGIYYLS